MTPQQFISKWGGVTLKERAAAQEHFLDICALLGEKTPAEVDPKGDTFTFEKGGTTATGGRGWADVWKKGMFAWEFKSPGEDLVKAYSQLKKYADMLENPPLLIVSDINRIEIHTNFTNTVKVSHAIALAELINPAKRDLLRAAFSNPENLRPGVTRQQVTTDAAATFSKLAHALQAKGYEPHRVAHFLNRIIFCMFAEDVGLLPNKIFTKLATASVAHPEVFESNAKQLFGGMSKGGAVAFEVIDWFNGGLFEDDATLPLDKVELQMVLQCAELDWSNIEPSIFGTLFERGLDPGKRSQQGAHYTDPDTIMKIVRPVVLEPWEREWETEKAALARLIDRAKVNVSEAAQQRLNAFLERLSQFRVLDPACGSGNFLYLSLRGLKDFEKRVILEAETLGLPPQFPRVGPDAMLGIEVNPYAAELARITIWIGELQWMIENGFSAARNPILRSLDQIECRDAILGEDGGEPAWPAVDVIVGNPPFLGQRFMLRELGQYYVSTLRARNKAVVSGNVDLVVYWFLKSEAMLHAKKVQRVGLVATNSIRGGDNQAVLKMISDRHQLFDAWPDQPWVNEGAAVRVSLVCFTAKGDKVPVRVNGGLSPLINADLSASTGETVDPSNPAQLPENKNVAYAGFQANGPFDVTGTVARDWLKSPVNPNGRLNSDVLRPMINAADLVRRNRDEWIVDFGAMSMQEASMYERPFLHVQTFVKPVREGKREAYLSTRWWLHKRTSPAMRNAVAPLKRFLATPMVAKWRLFRWMSPTQIPENACIVFARADDLFFGFMQSKAHTVWSLKTCTFMGAGNDPRYTPTSCFETFPFPDKLPLSADPSALVGNAKADRLVKAAFRLNELRENWLNPIDLVDRVPESAPGYPDRLLPKSPEAAAELSKRTLTNLYNANPTWLQFAHAELDEAVADSYEWEWPLTDEEIMRRLFVLNQNRLLAMDVVPINHKRAVARKPMKHSL